MKILRKTTIIFLFCFLANLGTTYWSHATTCQVCSKETSTTCSCLLASFCSVECQKKDWKKHKALCIQARKFKGGVSIKPSTLPNAGLGLFAEKDFKNKEAVALYFGRKPNMRSLGFTLNEVQHNYLFENGDTAIVLDSPKALPAHALAGMANDNALTFSDIEMLKNIQCDDVQSSEKDINSFVKRYLSMLSYDKKNSPSTVVPTQGYPELIALAPIKKGDEIFFQYGLGYWSQIPVSICYRKGVPEGGFQILRSFSKATEEFLAEVNKDFSPSTLFSNYMDEGQFSRNLNYVENPTFILGLLFASPAVGQLTCNEPHSELQNILNAIKFDETLSVLRSLPNQDFWSETHTAAPHPIAIELMERLEKDSPDSSFDWNVLQRYSLVRKVSLQEFVAAIKREALRIQRRASTGGAASAETPIPSNNSQTD